MANLNIIHTNDKKFIMELVEAGYEPVECSIGGESVVGALAMDHHGTNSHLEGVSIRAYRDHFGVRKDDLRFVVTGAGDADATFAIASLAGMLPHPSRAPEFETAPGWLKAAMTQDLTNLAVLINEVDTAPIGVDKSATKEGNTLLVFQQMESGVHDVAAFYSGVDRWRNLTGPRAPAALIEAAKKGEQDRIEKARLVDCHLMITEDVFAVSSGEWGFDVWYGLWGPCAVALNPHEENITIGCQDVEAAEKLFGPGGLKNVFPKLGEGWGGREAIGGSPRGQKMTWDQATVVATKVAALALHNSQ